MIKTNSIPRVMDLRGTYKGGGGPDKTVLNSAAQHDPSRVHVLVTYLRQSQDHEFQIPEVAHRLGINYVDVTDDRTIDRTCLRRLADLIREHRLQVVHAHDDKTLLYGWLLKRMMPELNIMYTCHSHAIYGRSDFMELRGYLSFKVRQCIQIMLMKRYLKPIITVSRETGRRLIANGLSDHDVAILHNGIDIDTWQRDSARPVLRDELDIPAGGFLVGTVARITYDKDLPTFYQVAEQVAKQAPGVTFVIVGDGYGEELQLARAEVSRRGLERLVRFTGHRTDLKDIYASLDVFLMTSLTEGMPNTLLEAMAMGVPSVSTSVGGIPELIEQGQNGFLAPVGDAALLASHVISLLDDSSLRNRCAAASRRRIEERFDFARRVSLMEDYYAWFAGAGPLPARTMT